MGDFLTIAAAGASIAANRQEAGAKQVELDIAAREEKTAVKDRAIQRKRRINAVLGSQNALAAAKGIQLMGSVANISLVDAERSAEDSRIDELNTSSRLRSMKRQRKSIGRISRLRTATTILKTGASIANRGGSKPAGGGEEE